VDGGEEQRLNRRVTRSAFYNEKPNVNYLVGLSRFGDRGNIATILRRFGTIPANHAAIFPRCRY
jgi:hypothetical protein